MRSAENEVFTEINGIINHTLEKDLVWKFSREKLERGAFHLINHIHSANCNDKKDYYLLNALK